MTEQQIEEQKQLLKTCQNELVWYSPEWDSIHISKYGDSYIFCNEHGYFIKCYITIFSYKISDFYLIGEL